ncbi:MAG: hypothetical protein J7L47_06120 [Candidatus Odinarchaeota archaeon]|nr:hypothetical protein [Candidatus Odinarchaeota archaeon]
MKWIFPFLRKPKLRLKQLHLKAPPKPSQSTISILVVIAVLFLLGGGLFTVTNIGKPWFIPVGQDPKTGAITFIYTQTLNRQFSLEGLIASVFYFVGFLGFYFIYESTKHAKNIYRTGFAERLLLLGILLSIVSLLLLQWMLTTKVPSIY